MTGPPPVVAALRSAVRAELVDLPPDSLVLVGCSGGADSLALAAATAFVAPRAGLRAGAVVVDHGLQAGSGEVAQRAADQCRGLDLAPVEVVTTTVPAPSGAGGPEAAARAARYAALEQVAARTGAAAVLLGHTLDDQAETVLLGLARGSGGRSLAGMPRRRGLLRRPLLEVRREETAQVCRLLGLDAWQDPSNSGEAAPLRSQVRHHVLPVLEDVLGPGVARALARTADQLRADTEVLDAAAEELLAAARTGPDIAVVADEHPGRPVVELDVTVLTAAPRAVRHRVLHRACVLAGVPAGALQHTHVLAVDGLVTSWHGQGPAALPGAREAARAYGRLTLCAQVGPAGAPDGPGATHREQ